MFKLNKLVFIFSLITLSYLSLTFIFDSVKFKLIDFPCHARVEKIDNQDQYLDAILPKNFIPKDVEIFGTATEINSSGAGCLRLSLNNGDLKIISNHLISTASNHFRIDKKEINIGDSFDSSQTKIGFSHPWWTYIDYIHLKNEGYVKGLITNTRYEGQNGDRKPVYTLSEFNNSVLVITGSIGSRKELIIFTPIVFLLAAGYSIFHFLKRKTKTKK
jgi:hypothetical protein